MDHDFFNQHQEEDQRLSRRGLVKKAGLMGLSALGICSAFEGMVPSARAEGPQSFLHVVQRPGTPPGGPSSSRKRRTVNELLTILQRHPGGPQAIEAARRGGANFSFGANPPKLQDTNPPVVPFSVVLVPGHLQVEQSWAELRDVYIFPDSTIQIKTGAKKALFHTDFPQKGWYLLNIEGITKKGWPQISAKMVHQQFYGPGQTIQNWSYPVSSQTGNLSFPALFQYKGGLKEFALHVDIGAFLFLEFSAENL